MLSALAPLLALSLLSPFGPLSAREASALELDDPLHVLPELREDRAALAQGWAWRGPVGQSGLRAFSEGGTRFLALVEIEPTVGLVVEVRVEQGGVLGPWIPAAELWVGEEARVYSAELDSEAFAAQVRVRGAGAVEALSWELLHPVGEPRLLPGAPPPPPSSALSPSMEAIGVTSRDDWGADSTTCSTTEDDWYRMAIHHTAGGETYGGTVEGAVQALQAYAMGSDYCDIPYQYLVGYDGSLWEGRELTYQSGATGGGNNDGNIAVCFLGCFDSGGCGSSYDTPPDTMIVSARLLIQTLAVEHSFVTDDDTMKGHRDWPENSTACPGDLVYARLDEIRETGAPFQASVVSASFSEGVPLLLHPGEEVSLSVGLRNGGTETWTSLTSLAPWPRDAASPLANETWVSTTRVAHPAADVAPGETGSFTFTVRGGEVGELSLPLALVEDGVTWFADIPWGGGPADGFLTLTVRVEAEESDGGGTDGGSDGATDGGTDGGAADPGVERQGHGTGAVATGRRGLGAATSRTCSAR